MNRRWLLAGLALLFLPSIVWCGQKKEKKKNPPTEEASTAASLPPERAIDQEISEMLGYWQVGDLENLHKYYSDAVTVVSGTFEPPLVGWTSYAAAFTRQRTRLGSLRLDRRNTLIFVRGDMAWATYQWEFSGIVDGKYAADRGQTTLIFTRQADRWVIVHNHTSEICGAQASPQPAQPQAPGGA